MAIELGGVTLSPHMLWVDEVEYSDVEQSTLRTLGGDLRIYSQSLTKGRPITLVASDDQGWLTRDQVDSVRALASAAGNIYTLVIGIQTFSVVFRHEEPPAFAAQPLVFRVDAPSTDYYTATIKLMTV